MTIGIERRKFVRLLGGAAAWPLAARAQQGVRRIGVLTPGDENDPMLKTWVSAFAQALAGLGWTDGRNVRMDLRWAGGDANRIPVLARELVGLQPAIVVTTGFPTTVAVQWETRTIPIVFVNLGDPVAQRIVPRLNQPGGNVTGFATLEPSLGGKWLELLSEIAPGLTRVAFMFNPAGTASAFMPSLETAAAHSRSSRSLRTFTATQRSKRPSWPWGASREAALLSCRMGSWPSIARRSYWRRPGATSRRFFGCLTLPERADCSPTDPTR
jgi:ABC-type uncharacterized transport system substrate-binding protein